MVLAQALFKSFLFALCANAAVVPIQADRSVLSGNNSTSSSGSINPSSDAATSFPIASPPPSDAVVPRVPVEGQ